MFLLTPPLPRASRGESNSDFTLGKTNVKPKLQGKFWDPLGPWLPLLSLKILPDYQVHYILKPITSYQEPRMLVGSIKSIVVLWRSLK